MGPKKPPNANFDTCEHNVDPPPKPGSTGVRRDRDYCAPPRDNDGDGYYEPDTAGPVHSETSEYLRSVVDKLTAPHPGDGNKMAHDDCDGGNYRFLDNAADKVGKNAEELRRMREDCSRVPYPGYQRPRDEDDDGLMIGFFFTSNQPLVTDQDSSRKALTDCNERPTVYPGFTEVPGNGVDEDPELDTEHDCRMNATVEPDGSPLRVPSILSQVALCAAPGCIMGGF